MNKKFVYITLLIIILFLSFHYIVWNIFTYKILDPKPYTIGDLSRISYQLNSIHNRIDEVDLPKTHITYKDFNNNKIDIITIGDSFSNGASGGKNPYYQDYISTMYNVNVMNINTLDSKYTFIETINALIDNGWLQKIHPKIIIIETVGRKFYEHYSRNQDWDIKLINNFEEKLYNQKWRDNIEIPSIINTANYKVLFYSLLYNFKINAKDSVYKLELKKDLFSVKNKNSLLIYEEDLKNLKYFNDTNIDKINQNFNLLSDKLKQIGIELFVMPAVDKYDLYYPFIKDNFFHENNLFEYLRRVNKKYYLIDTKKILQEELLKNEIDIYYADDTHWSYKASKIISNSLKKEIENVISK
ncbi:hypothetical protein [Aliarcobacter cryaerophilus]|uniref:hypothetical protein n=1 Tax=Aliarcobacter cryaerophilus TaxID=28198 RepID=UPI003DA5D943